MPGLRREGLPHRRVTSSLQAGVPVGWARRPFIFEGETLADNRSRAEKLRAMANQTASPHEAEIAKRLLKEMGQPVEAPRASTPTNEFE